MDLILLPLHFERYFFDVFNLDVNCDSLIQSDRFFIERKSCCYN